MRLAEYGLNDPLNLLITGIGRNPGRNQDFFAEYYILDKATVARGAAKLEEMGLIIRETSEDDKRRYKLYLTERGQELYRLVISVYREWTGRLSSGFTTAETDMANSLLLRMADAINEQSMGG